MSAYETWKQAYPLHALAQLGDVTGIKSNLDNLSLLINTVDNEKWYPISYACFEGHVDMVEFLLSNGADITSPNHFGSTSLHLAVGTGNTGVVSLLLSFITTLDQFQRRNEDKETPRTLLALIDDVELRQRIKALLDEKEIELNR